MSNTLGHTTIVTITIVLYIYLTNHNTQYNGHKQRRRLPQQELRSGRTINVNEESKSFKLDFNFRIFFGHILQNFKNSALNFGFTKHFLGPIFNSPGINFTRQPKRPNRKYSGRILPPGVETIRSFPVWKNREEISLVVK